MKDKGRSGSCGLRFVEHLRLLSWLEVVLEVEPQELNDQGDGGENTIPQD